MKQCLPLFRMAIGVILVDSCICCHGGHFNVQSPSPASSQPTLPGAPTTAGRDEAVLRLDWGDQLNNGSEEARRMERSTLTSLPARVVERVFPEPDVGSISDERAAVFELGPNGLIPRHSSARKVRLSVDLPWLISQFLSDNTMYTLIFTSEGKLFDVVDQAGRSGFLAACNQLDQQGSTTQR